MQKDDNHDAGPSAALPDSPSDSDHDASPSGFPKSARLRDKLNKLANRRLDLSAIEFVNGAPEFHGGYASVSRALLVSPSSGQDRATRSNPTKEDGLDSPGPAPGEASRQLKLALREAEFVVGLSHKNVIKLEGFVEDLYKDERVVWLVFPWAKNGNLKNFIASAEWEIPERISLIYDVARGVEYLHSQQPPIRHGDLKSINILVNSEYRAVITDFGSARRQTTEDLVEETSQTENKPPPVLSLEPAFCAFCGATNTMTLTLKKDHFTLRWAAPELLHKKRASLASDIWALGCVVYEVMTNSIPFQDVDVDNAVVIRVLTGNLPSVTNDARMALIKALCSLALECWSSDPQKRPSAEDCRKSIDWMPMIRPDPVRTADAAASRARSPGLLMRLGEMYRRQDDYVNATDFYTKALGSYREIGDSEGKAAALVELAQVHRLRNEFSQAITSYSEALQICSDIGDRRGRADTLWGLAEVHRGRNEYSQAVTFYSEALQIYTDIGHRPGRADALWGLAEVHRLRDEYSQAIQLLSEALQISMDIGDRYGRAWTLTCLATVHRDQEDHSNAIRFYSEAAQVFEQIGNTQDATYASNQAAQLRRRSNREEAP
ncbi:hypothetical protein FRC05_007225 [Tulasnella sp. 425]|nr:hypothetical protein FRC05_007225 [Tulasnella sp. 425]